MTRLQQHKKNVSNGEGTCNNPLAQARSARSTRVRLSNQTSSSASRLMACARVDMRNGCLLLRGRRTVKSGRAVPVTYA